MFNKKDMKRDQMMLTGSLAKKGYDWWWHSFTAVNDATGEETPFFIEYFICNPKLAQPEAILGQSDYSKQHHLKPSYLMVKAGCWGKNKCQLHRFFAWKDVSIEKKAPYNIQAADCLANETQIKGSIKVTEEDAKKHPEYMCDAGEISWNLYIDKKIAYNVGYGASNIFRWLKAFEMYWHAEGMKSTFSGSITLNGQTYTVRPETSYGYADKNWGKNFTSPWVWLSSNCMKSRLTGKELKNSVFDIGGGRPKIFFLALNRQLLSAFYYEGHEYEYNFSKFWTGCKTQFHASEAGDDIVWHVRQENKHTVMVTDIHCAKKDMLWVNYESPDGAKRHDRLWNGGNGVGRIQLFKKNGRQLDLIDDIDVTHIGCEYGEYDSHR